MPKYILKYGWVSCDTEPFSQEAIAAAKKINEQNSSAVFDWHDEFIYRIPGYPVDRDITENLTTVLTLLKEAKAAA